MVLVSGCMIHCFLSHFYIKPQLSLVRQPLQRIASYLISTSNHNKGYITVCLAAIASYLISTSNHNWCIGCSSRSGLLLISFLHQTTTPAMFTFSSSDCFLSHFYIKPQPYTHRACGPPDCFLSHFYIKPQRILYNPFIYNELWHVAHIRSG